MPHISEADLKQAEKGSNEGISQGSAGAVWFHYFSEEKEGGWGGWRRGPRAETHLSAVRRLTSTKSGAHHAPGCALTRERYTFSLNVFPSH